VRKKEPSNDLGEEHSGSRRQQMQKLNVEPEAPGSKHGSLRGQGKDCPMTVF
jgi:hypothetical protein